MEVAERLAKLEENLIILKDLKESLLPENLKDDVKSQWAIRYGLFECIQIIIDISCHLVSRYNLGNPKSYAECIELLRKYGFISFDLEDKLIKMVGLRNKLIHEYLRIEPLKLYDFLNFLDDFREFGKVIEPFI